MNSIMIENKQSFDATSLFQQKNQPGAKTCQIQPQALKQDLKMMEIPVYRRLYNIIQSHHFNNHNVFRDSLIKELFFLMKLAPFMEQTILAPFLLKVQEWYDSNDHKKIRLASQTLTSMIKRPQYKNQNKCKQQGYSYEKNQKAQRYTQISNGSMNFWNQQKSRIKNRIIMEKNKNLLQNSHINNQNQSYRPMTAKYQGFQSKNSRIRPLSSGKPISSFNKQNCNNLVSTNAQTSDYAQTLINEGYEPVNQYCVDIDYQIKRNKDFVRKYRTMHPEQQPFHQQLFKLFNQPIPTSQFQSQTVAKNSLSNSQQKHIQSRNCLKKYTVKHQQDKDQENLNPLTQQFLQIQTFVDNLQQESMSENDSNQIQSIIQDKTKKVYRKDRPQTCKPQRTILGWKQRPHTGLIRLNDLSPEQASLMEKLNKLTFKQQNLKHKHKIEDDQILFNSLDYLKLKQRQHRESKRKNQSSKIQSIKKLTRNVKSAMIRPLAKQNIISEHFKEDHEDEQNKQNINLVNLEKEANFFDLSTIQKCQLNGKNKFQNIGKRPSYDQRRLLSPKYDNEINKFRKFKKNLELSQQKSLQSAFPKPHKVISHERFDVLNHQNIQNFNYDTLQQIEKIKNLTSGNNARVSSKKLMKALFIDAYNNLQSKQNISISQRNFRKIQPYNNGFFMISNPNLKKKTKKRKLTKKKLKK